MLSNQQKDKLKSSWGDKATSMSCMAEVRIYDPLSAWECYIYAMNPEDEDEISCIINGFTIEAIEWRLNELYERYNVEGEPVQLDQEYRPRRAAELFKILHERKQ